VLIKLVGSSFEVATTQSTKSMAESVEKKKSFQEKLMDKYRLVLIDDDTLGEVRTTKVSPLGILLGSSFLILLVGLLSAALISFTPLRFLVPGYADVTNNRTYMELLTKLSEIETELDNQRIYTNGLKNMLNPSGISVDDIGQNGGNSENYLTKSPSSPSSSMEFSLEHYYFCSPLKGEISAAFDIDNKHFGVDIVAEKDSPVKSILNGVVVTSDWSVKTGNTISIQHDNNLISVYKHNSVLLKKIGESVKAGEAIAIIGNTGILTSGPHVHFELWNKGIAVDPEDYINFN